MLLAFIAFVNYGVCVILKSIVQSSFSAMPIITVVRAVQKLRFSFQHFLYRNAFPPQLQVAFPSGFLEHQNSAQSEGSILDDFLWFAAPKSKVCTEYLSAQLQLTLTLSTFTLDITWQKEREARQILSRSRELDSLRALR